MRFVQWTVYQKCDNLNKNKFGLSMWETSVESKHPFVLTY